MRYIYSPFNNRNISMEKKGIIWVIKFNMFEIVQDALLHWGKFYRLWYGELGFPYTRQSIHFNYQGCHLWWVAWSVGVKTIHYYGVLTTGFTFRMSRIVTTGYVELCLSRMFSVCHNRFEIIGFHCIWEHFELIYLW